MSSSVPHPGSGFVLVLAGAGVGNLASASSIDSQMVALVAGRVRSIPGSHKAQYGTGWESRDRVLGATLAQSFLSRWV